MSRIEKILEKVTVLEDGTVLNKPAGKELKQYLGKSGYMYAFIDKVGFVPVHQLVATKFLAKTGINPDGTIIEGRYEVNHKDKDRTNNKLENLEWCDRSYNLRYSGIRKNRKDLSKKVFVWNPETDIYSVYPSLREVARQNGVYASTLHKYIKTGKPYCGSYLLYMGDSTEEEYHNYIKQLFESM